MNLCDTGNRPGVLEEINGKTRIIGLAEKNHTMAWNMENMENMKKTNMERDN